MSRPSAARTPWKRVFRASSITGLTPGRSASELTLNRADSSSMRNAASPTPSPIGRGGNGCAQGSASVSTFGRDVLGLLRGVDLQQDLGEREPGSREIARLQGGQRVARQVRFDLRRIRELHDEDREQRHDQQRDQQGDARGLSLAGHRRGVGRPATCGLRMLRIIGRSTAVSYRSDSPASFVTRERDLHCLRRRA